MPVRISYKVASFSSEDDNYRATELHAPGPACKGWRSDQYCTYPQEIVLQMERRAALDRVQMLVHSAIIPSSTEIFIGDVPTTDDSAVADPRKALYLHLGHVDWSKNKENSYRGRQMQTVEFAGGAPKALFVKLVMRKNHMNRLNEYNQVSLMGVNLYGSPPEDVPAVPASGEMFAAATSRPPHREELGFLMYTDPDIVEVIRKLEDRRMTALVNGDEEGAVRCKGTIANLEKAGQEVGAKVAAKRVAVEEGNFDEANATKKEIESEREEVYRRYGVYELLQMESNRAAMERGGDNLPPVSLRKPLSPRRSRSLAGTPEPPPPRPRRSSYVSDHDAMAVGRKKEEEAAADTSPQKGRDGRRGKAGGISGNELKELELSAAVFGRDVVDDALDKSPAAREKACAAISDYVGGYDPAAADFKPGKVLRATANVLARLFKDNVWAVFRGATDIHMQLFGEFLHAHGKNIAEEAVRSSSVKCYRELIVRGGDPAERVQDKAEDAIKVLLTNERIQKQGQIQRELSTPIPAGGKDNPKLSLSRAELVLFVVEKKLAAASGLTTGELADFGLSAATHQSSPVRAVGTRIVLRLYDADPKAVARKLPQDTPSLRKSSIGFKTLFEEISKRDGKRRA